MSESEGQIDDGFSVTAPIIIWLGKSSSSEFSIRLQKSNDLWKLDFRTLKFPSHARIILSQIPSKNAYQLILPNPQIYSLWNGMDTSFGQSNDARQKML